MDLAVRLRLGLRMSLEIVFFRERRILIVNLYQPLDWPDFHVLLLVHGGLLPIFFTAIFALLVVIAVSLGFALALALYVRLLRNSWQ